VERRDVGGAPAGPYATRNGPDTAAAAQVSDAVRSPTASTTGTVGEAAGAEVEADAVKRDARAVMKVTAVKAGARMVR
jgi:hypothetical protein